jgi:hypothetical protein
MLRSLIDVCSSDDPYKRGSLIFAIGILKLRILEFSVGDDVTRHSVVSEAGSENFDT